MISYEDTIAIVREYGSDKILQHETVKLSEIVDRVCAENIVAPLNIQPFNNSAMDGFAIRADDIANASNETPTKLEVYGRIAAGDGPAAHVLPSGACIEIMTGAPVPEGADSVVPVELVDISNDNIIFKEAIKTGANVRMAGEDFKSGMEVLNKGDLLKAQHILVLATLGVSQVKLYRKPKVALISTGKELVDDFEHELKPGQIYNSNGPYLHASLLSMGAEVCPYATIKDEEGAFVKSVKDAIDKDVDVIISTGAVSAGKYDFIRGSLEEMGAKILFHKVRIRPGKPVLFARLPGGTLFFGLPGNPVAGAAGLRFFVKPLLNAMSELPVEKPVKAILQNDYSKAKSEFRFFMKAICSYSSTGNAEVEIMDGQKSFMVRPFLKANSWAVMPEGASRMQAGDVIDTYLL
jgi:molybdopterin molybdotransferase